jgi:hypothetical protein
LCVVILVSSRSLFDVTWCLIAMRYI